MKKPPCKPITDLIGLLLCTLPPALTVLMYFPIWRGEGGGKLLSGFTLILLCLCARPLFKQLKALLSSSASYVPWLILLVLFLLLSRIAEEMTVISAVGFIGNLAGAVVMRLGSRGEKDEK